MSPPPSEKKITAQTLVTSAQDDEKANLNGNSDSISSEVDILKKFEDSKKLTIGSPTWKRQKSAASSFEASQFDPPEVLNEDSKTTRKVIKQNHPYRVIWDLFVICLSVWDGYSIPVFIAFDGEFNESLVIELAEWVIDFFFVIDIFLNFRTSFFNPKTGEEILNVSEIAFFYLRSFNFWVDMLSIIPFEIVVQVISGDVNLSKKFRMFSMLKLLRLLRLDKFITYMNTTEDIKLSLNLLKLCFFLVLYVHIIGCLLYFLVKNERTWIPPQFEDSQFGEQDFYESGALTKYYFSLYNSIMILTGNEIMPSNHTELVASSILYIFGALINANIFGTIAVIVTSLNRKAQRFQEKIDVANTSMKNMKLPEAFQNHVREFMLQTQSNLDNQKELDEFMNMISPSLRNQVTKHIFLNAISHNPILQGSSDVIDFVINDVTTLLYLPEDIIVQQGQDGDSLFFIAKGDCAVWVRDHTKVNKHVNTLHQSEYFGEVALLTQSMRTATVKSSNYCTLASLNSKIFYELCNSFPDILIKMKEKTLEYQDPWKRFKLMLLSQIDYFQDMAEDRKFMDEVHYSMSDEFFDSNTEIIGTGEECSSIIFIVSGEVELLVFDQEGNEYVLEVLRQGDIIGQYSVLFGEGFLFTAKAKTATRILTIHQEFFFEQRDKLAGLDEALDECETLVEESGIPICDYKVMKFNESPNARFKRAIERSKVLNLLQHQVRNKFMDVVHQAVQQKKQKPRRSREARDSNKSISHASSKSFLDQSNQGTATAMRPRPPQIIVTRDDKLACLKNARDQQLKKKPERILSQQFGLQRQGTMISQKSLKLRHKMRDRHPKASHNRLLHKKSKELDYRDFNASQRSRAASKRMKAGRGSINIGRLGSEGQKSSDSGGLKLKIPPNLKIEPLSPQMPRLHKKETNSSRKSNSKSTKVRDRQTRSNFLPDINPNSRSQARKRSPQKLSELSETSSESSHTERPQISINSRHRAVEQRNSNLNIASLSPDKPGRRDSQPMKTSSRHMSLMTNSQPSAFFMNQLPSRQISIFQPDQTGSDPDGSESYDINNGGSSPVTHSYSLATSSVASRRSAMSRVSQKRRSVNPENEASVVPTRRSKKRK